MGSSPSLRLWKSTPNAFRPAMPGNSVIMSLGLACNCESKNIFTFFVRTFDRDKNNFIDFKEFLLAIDVTSGGSPKEKLQWAFRWWRHLEEWNQSEYLPFLNFKENLNELVVYFISVNQDVWCGWERGDWTARDGQDRCLDLQDDGRQTGLMIINQSINQLWWWWWWGYWMKNVMRVMMITMMGDKQMGHLKWHINLQYKTIPSQPW